MYQKDYILRLIEVFVKFLARILHLRENKEYQQALTEIGEAYRTLVGIPVELVHAFTDVELLNALKMGDQWNPKRCEILAVLLKEEGDNLLALGNETLATTCFAKALSLFLEIPDQHEKIQDLTLRLKEQVLPDRILHKLFCHYEMKQQYANAENILFELAESRGTSLLQEGREFYARLKEKSREDLRKGNLPMEELDSGCLEFEQLCNTRKLRKEKGDSPG